MFGGADLNELTIFAADFSYASFVRANLQGATLIDVNLRHCDFQDANLIGANLSHCDFQYAFFKDADLRGADLRGADLSYCDFYDANLDGVLINSSTTFYEANFSGVKNVPDIPMICPEEGSFIGWKKANGHIIKLEILADAKRSSATGRKCRCDKARVLTIENLDGTPTKLKEISSDHDSTFIYRVGEVSKVDNFCEDRFRTCASGIHFFINRQEAVKYPN
jgi:uncharacterized protein YjbI with pentapeptide repeats